MNHDHDSLLLEDVVAEKPSSLAKMIVLKSDPPNSTKATLAAAGSVRRKATMPSTNLEARAGQPRAAREPYEP
jgi:hypothetical protein